MIIIAKERDQTNNCKIIANQAVSVDKTTVTTNWGVGLTREGNRALPLDGDPQYNNFRKSILFSNS